MQTLQQIITTLTALVMTLSAQVGNLSQNINPQTQQGQVLGASTTGLVGYWNFDEGSGTTASDSSGNGNTGTLVNGPTWTSGNISGALNFDNSNDLVSIVNESNFDFSINQPVTFSVWIKPTNLVSDKDEFIIAKGHPSSGRQYAMRIRGAGTGTGILHFFYVDSASGVHIYSTTDIVLNNNNWYHVAITYTFGVGSSAKLYVNGTETGSSWTTGTGNNSPINTAYPLSIGAESVADADEQFGGVIDEVRIYNRALSASEILDIYNDTGTVTPPPPSDTTAPSTPTSLTATAVSSFQINLTWSASTDNVGVTGYDIYSSGTLLTTVTGTSYSNTGLSASTNYSYTIRAKDAAGNSSAQSTSVSATTQAGAVGASGNIYIAQNSAGSANGSSCSNAYAISFFNTTSNWGSGAGKIGPGTIVHLCGIVTSNLTFQGDGTSGNSVTLLFENGAKMSKSTWGDGTAAININNRNYVTVNGGANGTIEATDNGTSFSTQHNTRGIIVDNSSNIVISNLIIKNLFVRTPRTNADFLGACVRMMNNLTNIKVFGINCSYVDTGIYYAFTGASNIEIYDNVITHGSAGIIVASSGTSGTANGVSLHNNTINLYDDGSDASCTNLFHNDGIHMWTSGSANIVSPVIYNNTVGPDMGACTATTGWFFIEGNYSNPQFYNNLFLTNLTNSTPTNGFIYLKNGGSAEIYNNSFISAGKRGTAINNNQTASPGMKIKNNIFINLNWALYVDTSSIIDKNIFWNNDTDGIKGTNFITTDPLLNTTYGLYAGSSAIGSGLNLTFLGITALNQDKNNTSRPLTGAWDIGAYQYTGTVTPPPTSTKFTTGQRIQTTSNLNVRSTASATGTLLGTQSLGALGTIINGGQSADGYFWWNVNYDNAPDGYSVEDYLTSYSAPIVGDFNSDGLVNSIDLSLLVSAWNTSNATYDLNHDSIVNSLDYVIMVQNWSL